MNIIKSFKKAIILSSLALFCFSCTDDEIELEEPLIEDELGIIGSWNAFEAIADQPLFDINQDGLNSTDLLIEMPCRNFNLDLKENGTFVYRESSWVWNTNTTTHSCNPVQNDIITEGAWEVNEDYSLIIFTVAGNQSFVAIDFDGNVLSFQSSSIFFSLNKSGDAANIYGTLYFSKN